MTLRVSALLAVACAAALALLAGPALSLEAYRPDPVDFEMAAPDGASASGGPVVSRTLRAPKRFNLVGMRWRSGAEPEIALRTRRSGGRWSRWAPLAAHADHAPDPGRAERTPVGASDPAWVGEADEVQYRMNRRVPGLRLHFVNARGTATPKDRARSAIRRVANSAVLSLAGAVGAREAGAAQRPSIVPRSAWGA